MIIILIPVMLSIISSLNFKNKNSFIINQKFPTLTRFYNITLLVAVLTSIYISYELFRVIYNVVFLDRIFLKGNQPLISYKLELLLCVYTFFYWIYFFMKYFITNIKFRP
jgi:hypothetical protein